MKRKDLTVGAELLYNSSTEWEYGKYGVGWLAVVVATEPYVQPRSLGLSHRPQPRPTDTGTGVLVDLYEGPEKTGEPRRKVVPLAHLRGPYAETAERVRAAGVENQKRTAALMTQQRADLAAAGRAHERAIGLNFDARWEGHRVSLTPAGLERLLDAFEAQQVGER